MRITHKQLLAARAALGLLQGDLATGAEIPISTLRRLEAGESVSLDAFDALQAYLEAQGIRFRGETGREGIDWPTR